MFNMISITRIKIFDHLSISLGAVLYIKKEFKLESEPTIEGLIVAMSLIGATIITTFSGAVSDLVGRRPLLIISSVLYFVSGLIMLWSPNVYVLLLARLIDGFGIGLAVTLVPVYISETAPSEIRGLLNKLPQFSGSGGMFLSYCMVFGMSLMANPAWRVMLGVLSIPSLLYFLLTIFCLPESPRWLVSKGKMLEAKLVLQRLHGREDVSGEMALLVEGLGLGGETSIEEYIIGPANELPDDQGATADTEQITFMEMQSSVPLMDPLVTLFGSVHEKLPEMGSMRSTMFPNFGSMFSVAEQQLKIDQWDEESLQQGSEDYAADAGGGESDDNAVGSMGIGGGWQLAWKWSERESEDGKKEEGFKRIYLHQEAVPESHRGSRVLLQGAMVHPSETAGKGPRWSDLFEPGVRRALFVGIGIQILQQFSGINGVLYYTPQILEQAGVEVLLSNIGISSDSASILISAVTTLLMLPSIGVAMRLMDISGRRFLMLSTIPILIASLVVLVVANLVELGNVVHAVLSTVSVIVYFCCFVMGFGPIPNILCSEIFPTRVRGVCIAICALIFWIGDIIVTYTLPVPETKGMPLEVIAELFAVGTKQAAPQN
uniref:Major facilitator superfamily (MFS) profile domain-containing protein n=1 Tax=Musa acuminata subsp. malaccensis TaxID=214687 RepID=A0A804J6G6_MUSAM